MSSPKEGLMKKIRRGWWCKICNQFIHTKEYLGQLSRCGCHGILYVQLASHQKRNWQAVYTLEEEPVIKAETKFLTDTVTGISINPKWKNITGDPAKDLYTFEEYRRKNMRVQCIKIVRSRTGLGLWESKELVDRIWNHEVQ